MEQIVDDNDARKHSNSSAAESLPSNSEENEAEERELELLEEAPEEVAGGTRRQTTVVDDGAEGEVEMEAMVVQDIDHRTSAGCSEETSVVWSKSDNQLDRQLKSLIFENPGPANQWNNPGQITRRSHRTKKKRTGNNDSSASDQDEDSNTSSGVGHTKRGLFCAADGRCYDLCDCLNPQCPGCHLPCEKCQSEKCGRICRQKRKQHYIRITTEGTNSTVTNPFVQLRRLR